MWSCKTPVVPIGRGRKPAAESDRCFIVPRRKPLPRPAVHMPPNALWRPWRGWTPDFEELCRLGPAGAPGAFYGRWKRAVGSARPSAGGADVSAVPRPPCNGCMTSALSGLERLSPSRSNSKCVAPPVGLPIAGHTSFPVKIVAARHRCAERPTPLCWRRSADPRWALLGSSIDAGAFPEAGIRFSLSEAGVSPRIGTMPDAKRRLAELVPIGQVRT